MFESRWAQALAVGGVALGLVAVVLAERQGVRFEHIVGDEFIPVKKPPPPLETAPVRAVLRPRADAGARP